MGKNYWRHQIGIWEFLQLNSIINMVLESSRSLFLWKIGVLRNYAEFTWKQLRTVTLVKKNQVQVLSCEFCKIFKNPFWQNTSGRLLLDFFSFTQLFFATQWTNRNQVFSIFEHVLSRLSNVMNITNFTSRNRRPSCSCWETDIPRDTRS